MTLETKGMGNVLKSLLKKPLSTFKPTKPVYLQSPVIKSIKPSIGPKKKWQRKTGYKKQ